MMLEIASRGRAKPEGWRFFWQLHRQKNTTPLPLYRLTPLSPKMELVGWGTLFPPTHLPRGERGGFGGQSPPMGFGAKPHQRVKGATLVGFGAKPQGFVFLLKSYVKIGVVL